MGVEEQARWSQEGAAVDQFAERYRADPEFKRQLDQMVVDKAKALQHEINYGDGEMRWFVTGRGLTGAATAFGPAALTGDTTRAVENGHNAVDAMIRGGVLGRPE